MNNMGDLMQLVSPDFGTHNFTAYDGKFNLLPSFQHSVSGNITTSSVSLSPREVGFGSGASAYLTNTVILYDGSKR